MQGVHASEKKRPSLSGSADEFNSKFHEKVKHDSSKKRYSDKKVTQRYESLDFESKSPVKASGKAGPSSSTSMTGLNRTPLTKALATSVSGAKARTPVAGEAASFASRSPVVAPKPSGMTAASAALSGLSRPASQRSVKTASSVTPASNKSPTPASKIAAPKARVGEAAAKARMSPFSGAKAPGAAANKAKTAAAAPKEGAGAKKEKEVEYI